MNEAARRRLDRILEADKEEMNEESKRAAMRDFMRVAVEYFDVDGEIALQTEQYGDKTRVTVGFYSLRVKNFSVLK